MAEEDKEGGQTTEVAESLLLYLKESRGFDFTGYKRASVLRRIAKRMRDVGIDDHSEYIDYLEVHPEEFEQLFNTILINVTSFFRDPDTWAYLQEHVIPEVLERKQPHEPIRVWSAGCASGEEAYTLAMVMAEAMGDDAFRDRVKIYATDVDEEALTQARHAMYPDTKLEEVPAELRERYFENNHRPRTFRADMRRAVIFGRHDLVQDAPIGRIDLLLCRNTLMYFNAETQARVIRRLHFALNDDGFLMLGKVEMLLSHSDLFEPVDTAIRIFRKLPQEGLRGRLRDLVEAGHRPEERDLSPHGSPAQLAFEASRVPQVVVDGSGFLRLANERARSLFDLHASDLQRPFQDTALSYRPAELRSAIDAARGGQPMRLEDVEWQRGDERVYLEIEVLPLPAGGAKPAVLVTFFDLTREQELEWELQRSNRELETAYEELQSANEELETTNEELQSTVEELETTNEELQSTNEELETTNEELQSTNDELHAINDELRQRSADLDEVNEFLESILESLEGAVAVLDRDFRVKVWSRQVAELWELRPEEVQDASFFGLDIGLPVHELAGPIRACVREPGPPRGKETVMVEATDRRGNQRDLRVVCTPLRSGEGEIRGVILLLDVQD